MELKIRKLREGAKIPQRATSGSAGMDLYACIDEPITLAPGQLSIVPTGIAIELPDNGERVAQMVIAPVFTPDIVEVDELSDTKRGAGGFGSTGRN